VKRTLIALLLVNLVLSACAPASAPTRQATLVPPTLTQSEPASAQGWEALLAQAKAASAQRYQFAVEQGAQIVPAADGKSFYVLWLPEGFVTASRRVIIVTLHGHASWAFDGLFLWHPFAAPRGYAILFPRKLNLTHIC